MDGRMIVDGLMDEQMAWIVNRQVSGWIMDRRVHQWMMYSEQKDSKQMNEQVIGWWMDKQSDVWVNK